MKNNDLTFSPHKQQTGLIIDDHLNQQRQETITKEIKTECKALYKKIAKQAHPDVNLNKDEQMQNLREIDAEILSMYVIGLNCPDVK